MTEQNNKKQTLGYFDIVGNIAITDKVFALNQAGKNNTNWLMNIFNPKIEGADGQSMFTKMQDGFDKVKGRTIYQKGTNGSSLEIKFGDRLNPTWANLVDENSFVKIGVGKTDVTNESGKTYKAWVFKKYLTSYDAILELQKILQIGQTYKVRMTGKVTYSEYRGETQRNFDLQTIYILTGNEEVGKEMPLKATFTQNILVTKDSVDKSQLETDGIAKLNAKLYVKQKKVFKVLPLTLILRAEDDKKKSVYSRMLDKYFTVTDETVRSIRIEGVFNSGYVAGEVTEADLTEDLLELIEDGIYSKEEILSKHAKRERVDELLLIRPVLVVNKTTGKSEVTFDDKEYTMDDLNAAEVIEEVIETKIEDAGVSIDEDLLGELEGL